MECGASLRGVADVTGEVPVVRPDAAPDEPTRELATTATPAAVAPSPTGAEDRTVPLALQPHGPTTTDAPVAATPAEPAEPRPPRPLRSRHVGRARRGGPRTHELRVIEATEAAATARPRSRPVARRPSSSRRPPPAAGFRLRPLLADRPARRCRHGGRRVHDDHPRSPRRPTAPCREYAVNDFGTNNSIAALIAAGAAMLSGRSSGAPADRWGAGLAGGAGASLVGWAALADRRSPSGGSTSPRRAPTSADPSATGPSGRPASSAPDRSSSPRSPAPAATAATASTRGSPPSPRCRSSSPPAGR